MKTTPIDGSNLDGRTKARIEARRREVGTQLLNELINEARSLGLKYLHLHATKDRINMYRKAGPMELEYPELELRVR